MMFNIFVLRYHNPKLRKPSDCILTNTFLKDVVYRNVEMYPKFPKKKGY